MSFSLCLSIILLLLSPYIGLSQSKNILPPIAIENELEISIGSHTLHGSLVIPSASEGKTLVIMVPGSGPTDRNGNSAYTKNNAFKMLADSLYNRGIASFRYDKRGVGRSASETTQPESSLRFEDMISDLDKWIQKLKTDYSFRKIIVLGHSEGSLIGMVASKQYVDKFISLAGPGQSADQALRDQLITFPDSLRKQAYQIIDSLKKGKFQSKIPKNMGMLFRPSVQPYLISWFVYDPIIEIKKLKIPVLILQGDTDIQVSVDDAEALNAAAVAPRLIIIKNMNHILKKINSENNKENLDSYTNPNLPLMTEVVEAIFQFCKE